MNKVFIVCEPTHTVDGVTVASVDLSPAAKFGATEVLVPFTQSMLATVPTVRMLKEKLKYFSDEDYILPIGDPVLMSTVAMVAGEQNGGRVKFLKWDKLIKGYIVIQVDTSGRAI